METNDRFRQYLENQMPDEYRRLLKIEEANEVAMQLPKDEITLRLEALGFNRRAVTAMSDTHCFSTPCDKGGEYNLVIQKGAGIYSRSGELSIRYEQGVDVWKSCGRILKEGFYTLDEFTLLVEKMERSHWYREKKDKKRLPILSILQRKVYDGLPLIFGWSQGKEIATGSGMPARTAQRFFGNHSLFQKVSIGTYMKKILYDEV
ncbi:MAG: hypothetical protein IPL92_01725 [Saprospiraceae bacterium]|nr:hypothetical protein [Candidatus Opimibacter iunctus]